MDVGVSVEGCLHSASGTPGLDIDSDLPSKRKDTQDWIEGCYSKLHAVSGSKALDNHLMKSANSPHEEMENGSNGEDYEYIHDRPGSRPESVGDPDYPVASAQLLQGPGGLSFMDFCKSEGCNLRCNSSSFDGGEDDFSDGEPAIFDLKGKRFKSYLEDLRNEGKPDPGEETNFPPNFPSNIPDAMSIMEARIAGLKSKSADGEHCTRSESEDTEPLKEETELDELDMDMDTSLQEYLESDNDIMSHPLYKRLCAAHISLCKVNHLYSRICAAHITLSKLGATDAQLKEMEELSLELENKLPTGVQATESNPELDKFMNEYCDFLEMHKNEFAKPFDEAMEFCKEIDEELATAGLRFLRDKGSIEQNLTNDTISRLQELPLEGEV